MKKTNILLGALCAFCLGLGALAVAAKPQSAVGVEAIGGAQAVSYDSSDWTYSGSGSQSTYWQLNSSSITYKGGSGWTDHMLLTDQFDTTLANYTMTATFTGTLDSSVADEAYCGFVPWFVDSNNWIMIYAQWVSWDRPTEIRAIHLYAKIDGKVNVYMMTDEGGWGWHNTYEWHEQWTDGCGILPADGFTLTVSKTRSLEAGVASDWFGIIAKKKDGTTFKTVDNIWLKVRDTGYEYGYSKPKVGFWCQKDIFQITDFSFNHDGYTKDSTAGFMTNNAYSFLETVSDAGVCGAIDADASGMKASLQSAYNSLSTDEKTRLANVTYGGGRHNVLSAYDYYISYANSIINKVNLFSFGKNDPITSSSTNVILIVSIVIAIAIGGVVILRFKTKHK